MRRKPEGSLAEVAVRWQDAQSENAEAVLTVTGEEGDNGDVRFAACVAEFALVLRRSQYAGSASIANVLARLNELRAGFADDAYKTEFVQIVSLAGGKRLLRRAGTGKTKRSKQGKPARGKNIFRKNFFRGGAERLPPSERGARF